MIETVEKICESKQYKSDEYLKTLSYLKESGKLSEKKPDAVRNYFIRLELNLEDSIRGIENTLSYMNYKCRRRDFYMIPQSRCFYLLKINEYHLEIEVLNQRTGRGLENSSMRFLSIDLRGSDEFWISTAKELLEAASGKLENINGFHRLDWIANCINE